MRRATEVAPLNRRSSFAGRVARVDALACWRVSDFLATCVWKRRKLLAYGKLSKKSDGDRAAQIHRSPVQLDIVRNANELRSWLRSRPKVPTEYVEYLAEECLERGHEFVAVVSTRSGLLGTFAAVDSAHTWFLAVRRQVAHAIEWLDAGQTRDAFPGLETFALQCMRTLTRANATVLFVKGYYKVETLP